MKIVLFLVLFSSYFLAKSETSETANLTTIKNEKTLHNYRLGITYSDLSGYGTSYLREINDRFAIKTQFFFFGSVDDKSSDFLMISFGTELQYNFVKNKTNRLYGISGFQYSYFEDDGEKFLDFSLFDTGSMAERINRHYSVGLGIGFEAFFFSNITIAVDTGIYGLVGRNTKKIEDSDFERLENVFNFGYGFGITLYYNF